MIWIELRRALRRLCQAPRFSLAVIASIAIAIGPILVASSVFEAAFLRDMAVKAPRDLLSIRSAHKGLGVSQIASQGLSFPDYQDLQAALPKESWRYISAWKVKDVSRSGMTDDQPLRIATVSGDYFRIANARFVQGYAPSDQEMGVVVTPALWRELSAGRATAVLTIYGQQFRVVGVVDESFHGLYPNEGINAWIPLSALPGLEGNLNVLSYREQQDLFVVVQTAKDSRIQSYRLLLATISSRLSDFHDGNRFAWHFEVARAQPTFLELLRTPRGQAAFAPLLVVICVLLIAATNVANLFVIRATSRERELQLRLALGIQRKHLLLYQCLEPIVLGLVGLLVGLWTGLLAVERLTVHPALQQLHLQSSAAAIVAACFAALLFVSLCVLIPVIRISRLREAGMIHEGQGITSRGVSRLQQSFLVLQFTLALAFTCVAVQLASAVRQQSAVDVGFDTRNLLVVKGARDALGLTPDRIFNDYKRVTAAVSSIPGVVAVSSSLSEFFGGYRMMTRAIMTSPTTNLSWEGGVSAAMDAIGPGYFAALGLPVSAGREFGEEDRPGTPGRVIVNQALAKLIAPNGHPLGMTLYELGIQPLEIIGVVPNVRATVGEKIQPVYYRSTTQSPIPSWVLYVRVAAFSPAITSALTNAVVKELPESGGRLKVYVAEEQRAERDMPATAIFWLATGLAAMAMLISGLGLYGVASHATMARRKEYGIRAAMGASPRQLATLVFGDGLWWTALSAAISLPFVWVGMRVTTAVVVGARQIPLAATVALVAIYFVVVFLALMLPAHRAASVSPTNALRSF